MCDYSNCSLSLFGLMLIISFSSCRTKESEIIFEIKNQCKDIPIQVDNEWKLIPTTKPFYRLEKGSSQMYEYLEIIKKDTGIVRGYYRKKTENNSLWYELSNCDTILFYQVEKTMDGLDTIFIKGYYKHLYDTRKLTKGQERFYRRNRDSLNSIRGKNLSPLPSLSPGEDV